MRAHTEGKDEMGKRFAIVIGVAAAGVMALGAQTATSSTGEPVDSVPPDLQLSGEKKQNLGQTVPTRGCLEHGRCPKNVQVNASCGDEECTARAEGKLTNVKNRHRGRTASGSRAIKLKPTRVLGSGDVFPGDTTTLALKLTKKTHKQALKALDQGKKVQAKVTVEATDAAGNVATAKRTIKLK